MNLLFDIECSQPNASGKRHGGARYCEIIFFRMIDLGIGFSCFYDSRKWLNPKVSEKFNICNIPLYDVAEISIQEIVNKYKVNRIYSALPHSIVNINGCDVFGTIHGLRAFETYYDWFFFMYRSSFKEKITFLLKKVFRNRYLNKQHEHYDKNYLTNSIKLITVSEHSYFAIKSYFPTTKKDIKIFFSPNTSSNKEIRINEQIQKYFLLVSGNRWEKNNLRGIIAFDRLVSAGLLKNVRLKITGCCAENFHYKIQNPSYIDFMDYVDDYELEELYANAFLLVYPSLNEGFGYPPLEALQYKTPVIASPFSSISELFEGGVLYFNPLSIEEIMNRMLIMMQEERHDEYAQRGYEQYLKIRKRQITDLDLLIEYITKE